MYKGFTMCRFSMYAYFVYIAVFCILMTATNSAVYYVVNLGICFCSNPCTNGVVICISEFFLCHSYTFYRLHELWGYLFNTCNIDISFMLKYILKYLSSMCFIRIWHIYTIFSILLFWWVGYSTNTNINMNRRLVRL